MCFARGHTIILGGVVRYSGSLAPVFVKGINGTFLTFVLVSTSEMDHFQLPDLILTVKIIGIFLTVSRNARF